MSKTKTVLGRTLEGIKEERAQECLASNWSHLLVVGLTNTDVDYIAERYAQSQTQELQEQNAELVDLLKGIVKQIEKGEKIGGYNLLTTSSIEYEFAQKLLTKHNHLKSNTNGNKSII